MAKVLASNSHRKCLIFKALSIFQTRDHKTDGKGFKFEIDALEEETWLEAKK